MDQSGHQKQQQDEHQSVTGAVTSGTPTTHTTPTYQNAPTMTSGAPHMAVPTPHHLAYQQAQQFHHQQQQQQQQQLQLFWSNQIQEIEQITDFKNHNLPLARIKKIMKADEDVRMISAEAPILFAKACEMFILELTLRSWIHTEENKRRTLQKNDIAAAITRTDIFDFLVDIVPRDDLKDDGLGFPRGALPLPAIGTSDTLPYYYMPQHPGQVGGPPGMLYPPHQPSASYMAWPPPQAHPPPPPPPPPQPQQEEKQQQPQESPEKDQT